MRTKLLSGPDPRKSFVGAVPTAWSETSYVGAADDPAAKRACPVRIGLPLKGNVIMRKSFVLSLVLLAGCASAAAEPARQPGSVIRRVATIEQVTAQPVVDTGQFPKGRIELVDAACQTGDPMPVHRTQPADVPPMPSARPLGPLAYIPNVCPVIAVPQQKPASPVVHIPAPKQVTEVAPQP